MAGSDRLASYARAYLLRADPDVDELVVDAFVRSDDFGRLIGVFDIQLGRYLKRYKALQGMPDPSPAPVADGELVFRLRNARAGEPYLEVLAPQLAPGQALRYLEITLPPGTGLLAEPATGTIAGTPLKLGEIEIGILYQLTGDPPAVRLRGALRLVVNADPKTLWKNLPSAREERYWKADEECASVAGPNFRMLAASKRGRSHAHAGSFRDDDFRIGAVALSGWYVAVVSDGAGSARYSRRGSQLICEEAMQHLDQVLGGEAGGVIEQAAQAYVALRAGTDAVATEAARQVLHYKLYETVGHAAYFGVKAIAREIAGHPDAQAAVKDFASTALIAACKRMPFGTLFAAYWVGDGAVAVYTRGKGVTLLGEADSGEFSGQTRFLDAAEVTQEALVRRTRFAIVDDATALILMSDGVSDPRFDTEAQLARLPPWDALWDELERAVDLSGAGQDKQQRLLSWLDFWSPGNHDDRTIAIIYPETRA